MSELRFWHPFADMRSLRSSGEVVIDHGNGCHVYDERGHRYLDATASLWYCNVGHGRTEIAEAIAVQAQRLASYSTFGDLANRPVLELSERVVARAPMDGPAVFFTSGGSDSVDTAVKLIRRYWQVVGRVDRTLVVTRSGSYHGMHVAGTSLAGIHPNRKGYGPLLEGVARVRWDSAEDLEQLIDEVGAERVAAFFCEPVIGAGGVFHSPDGYLAKVRDICRSNNIIFVADEVVTGFGRLGNWFASGRFDLEPDMIVCAKGITSGYLPMGALLVASWIREPFYEGQAGMWRHGYTYSGHATVAAAALANLDIIEREGLIARARWLERPLAEALADLADHDLVSEVRAGAGVLAAVQVDPELLADDPGLTARIVGAARDAGIMTRALATGALHVSPPLVITEQELSELAQGLRSALDACASQR